METMDGARRVRPKLELYESRLWWVGVGEFILDSVYQLRSSPILLNTEQIAYRNVKQ